MQEVSYHTHYIVELVDTYILMDGHKDEIPDQDKIPRPARLKTICASRTSCTGSCYQRQLDDRTINFAAIGGIGRVKQAAVSP